MQRLLFFFHYMWLLLSSKALISGGLHPQYRRIIETAARWARFAGVLPQAEGDGVRLETARGSIFVGTREAIAKILGAAPPAPAIAGYSLRSSHPEKLAARCKPAGIKVQKHGRRYAARLPAALGGALVFG